LLSLTRSGEPVTLNGRGASLLAALVEAEGGVVGRSALLEAGWPSLVVEEANLTVQIGILRKLLGTRPDGREWIATVPRVGYRLLRDEHRSLIDLPTIAVLPFANLSNDPEQAFFADGVAEELITALSRFKTFAVIARNSSFFYREMAVDVRK